MTQPKFKSTIVQFPNFTGSDSQVLTTTEDDQPLLWGDEQYVARVTDEGLAVRKADGTSSIRIRLAKAD